MQLDGISVLENSLWLLVNAAMGVGCTGVCEVTPKCKSDADSKE